MLFAMGGWQDVKFQSLITTVISSTWFSYALFPGGHIGGGGISSQNYKYLCVSLKKKINAHVWGFSQNKSETIVRGGKYVSRILNYFVSELVGALSQVSRQGFYQGWRSCWLVLWALSTTEDYIRARAEGDFHQEIYSWNKIRPDERSEKADNCQEDLWNEIQLKGS